MTDPTTGVARLDALVLWCGAVVAIAGAAGLLWRSARGAHRLARRVEDFIDDWAGTDEQPGIMTRMTTIEDSISMIEHELHPNSGSSLRDAVDRVDQRTARHLDPP